MQIQVTETRECCQPRDLKPLGGPDGPTWALVHPTHLFCGYCGRWHRGEYTVDAEWHYVPMDWPWQATVTAVPVKGRKLHPVDRLIAERD